MKDYKFKRVTEHGYIIIEDGHTMFPEDVVYRFERLNYLEEERLKDAKVLKDIAGYKSSLNDSKSIKCPICGKSNELKLTEEQYNELYEAGGNALIGSIKESKIRCYGCARSPVICCGNTVDTQNCNEYIPISKKV